MNGGQYVTAFRGFKGRGNQTAVHLAMSILPLLSFGFLLVKEKL